LEQEPIQFEQADLQFKMGSTSAGWPRGSKEFIKNGTQFQIAGETTPINSAGI
jgi:hypothetical protein